MPNGSGYTLEIVKVKSSGLASIWAIKATMRGEVRYRGYRYKAEAIKNLDTWQDCEDWYFPREFRHNFNTAEELEIVEVK